TLFALAQAAAQTLAAQGAHAAMATASQIGLTLLHDPVLHGTVADPQLADFNPRSRALLILERNKSALLFNPQQTAEELLAEAAGQARVTHPATAAVYSLDTVTNVANLTV